MAALKRISLHFLEHVGLRNPIKLPSSCSPIVPPSLFISRRNMAHQIYIGGLPYFFDHSSLLETFAPFGEIVEAHLPMNKKLAFRCEGYGFVSFSNLEDAERAKLEMNGKLLRGSKIHVRLDVEPTEVSYSSRESAPST